MIETDKRYTILIIDDDKDFVEKFDISFNRYYNVIKSYSARGGLKQLKSQDIDLVLLDVNLTDNSPSIEGLAVFFDIKSLSPYIPVVFISNKESVVKTLPIDKIVENIGAKAFLNKTKFGLRNHIWKEELDLIIQANQTKSKLSFLKDLKAVFFASNPKMTPPVEFHREVKKIKQALEKNRKINIELIEHYATTFDDFQDYMLEWQPIDIVHFSAHGLPKIENNKFSERELFLTYNSLYGIILERENGHTAHTISPKVFIDFFSSGAVKGKVKVVVLNACYSYHLAQLLSDYVPFVIGMSGKITTQAATEFSKGLYRSLCMGLDVIDAWEQGCIKIRANLNREYGTPVLFFNNKKVKRIFKYNENDPFATFNVNVSWRLLYEIKEELEQEISPDTKNRITYSEAITRSDMFLIIGAVISGTIVGVCTLLNGWLNRLQNKKALKEKDTLVQQKTRLRFTSNSSNDNVVLELDKRISAQQFLEISRKIVETLKQDKDYIEIYIESAE